MHRTSPAALLFSLLWTTALTALTRNPSEDGQKPTVPVDPECYMNTPQLIRDNGFPAENHTVLTPDGYLLGVFRIPATTPRNGTTAPVVFFQHGLIASSDTFLLMGRQRSFPFLLADRGYDVWLGNVRGNVYSMNHTTLTPDQTEFWDFSFQEMAEIDLPAMLNYVLKVTGQEELFYIGHSQGTAMGFIGFSTHPDLGKRVKLFAAMAPIARITYAKGLLGILKSLVSLEGLLHFIIGSKQFAPPSAMGTYIATKVCPAFALSERLCEDWDSLLTGFDISNINQTRYPIYSAHSDQSTSAKDIIHWAQLLRFEKVQKFDYGTKGNMEHYNSSTPPEYDVSAMAVPTVLISGGNDWIGDTRDVMWLTQVIYKYVVDIIFIDKYNHDDYNEGNDAPEMVYYPVMKIMERFRRDPPRNTTHPTQRDDRGLLHF